MKIVVENKDGAFVPVQEEVSCRDMGPKMLLLYALAKCASMTLFALLEKMRVELKEYRIEVSGTLSDDPPVGKSHFVSMSEVFVVGVADAADTNKVISAVRMTHEKYCGVSLMMQRIAPVACRVVVNGRSTVVSAPHTVTAPLE